MNKYCFFVFLSIFLLIIPISSVAKSDVSPNNKGLPEKYLLEDVVYVSQLEAHCYFACLEMIFNYYGIDTDQTELTALHGQAYNLNYQAKLKAIVTPPFVKPSYKFYFWVSIFGNQGFDDSDFVCSLFGLKYDNYRPKTGNRNHIASWDSYWTKLKGHISNNTPIVTCVDCLAWPLYLELHNIPSIYSLFERSSHSVLVVGYNENNRTVCVHDPHAGECGQEGKGTFLWVPVNIFRRAVRRSNFEVIFVNYYMDIITKTTNEPLSKDERFRLSHERNIEKIKGNNLAYDADWVTNNFKKLGINVWHQLKIDFKKSFLVLYPFYRFLNRFSNIPFDMILAYELEAKLRHEIAEYLNNSSKLLGNEELKNISKHDSELFYNESLKIQDLTNLTIELKDAVENNSIIKGFLMSKEIIDRICQKIDEIIEIEDKIIAGPTV